MINTTPLSFSLDVSPVEFAKLMYENTDSNGKLNLHGWYDVEKDDTISTNGYQCIAYYLFVFWTIILGGVADHAPFILPIRRFLTKSTSSTNSTALIIFFISFVLLTTII